MYGKNNRWIDAFRLSEEFHGRETTISSYMAKAEDLDEQGRFAEAEQLYITVGMPHKAIQMYDRVGRDEDVLRLVEKYHGEHLQVSAAVKLIGYMLIITYRRLESVLLLNMKNEVT